VVGAEESMRIEAGIAIMDAAKHGMAPSARTATGNNSKTLIQNVYGKPGA
jgi:hypothetical protein